MSENIKWMPPENFICPHCGNQNPDNGNKCGNCEKNPFKLPDKDAQLTQAEQKTFEAAAKRKSVESNSF